MKRFLSICLMILCLCDAKNLYARGFIAGFEDIPLMEGLTQNESDLFEFGNEETSYRETKLVSSNIKSFNKVSAFYENTLPQLGWKLIKKDSKKIIFGRENAVLEIIKINQKPLKINISLKNKN